LPGQTMEVSLPAVEDADSALLERLSAFIDADDGLMHSVERFCQENCRAIDEQGRLTSDALGTFSLQAMQTHQAFVSMVERLLEEHISSFGLTVDDFVGVVRRSGVEAGGRGAQLLRTIEATTDFDVLMSMMADTRRDGCLL
jgi:hypothetical protein